MVGTSCCHPFAYIRSPAPAVGPCRPSLQEQAPDRPLPVTFATKGPFPPSLHPTSPWSAPGGLAPCVSGSFLFTSFYPCVGEPLQSRLVLTSLHWPQWSPGLTGDSGNGKRSAWALWGILGSPLLLPCPHGSAGTGRRRRLSGTRRVFLCVCQRGSLRLEMLLMVLRCCRVFGRSSEYVSGWLVLDSCDVVCFGIFL